MVLYWGPTAFFLAGITGQRAHPPYILEVLQSLLSYPPPSKEGRKIYFGMDGRY
jgi:hypothetical protein